MSEISDQRLLLALKQARTKLEALQREKTEPIAIIGMDCRFPGGANNPDAYWQLLANGLDVIAPIPSERWDVEAYYDPDPEMPGKMYAREGGFLSEVDTFDAAFFGIAPREADCMDPQQRVLLEVSYSALENAGQALDSLKGSSTGVFMGVSFDDYSRLSLNSGDPTLINAYSSLGNSRSIAVGRIAYALGLQGPTMQLDTACSSSLLAIHLAVQSLRSGDCEMALAGGVNLILSPEVSIGFCQLKAMSADGRCKTFDASADGYGRGEGCGVVILKRLSEAIANQDNILALIRGSAVNHDGASNGLTAPNGAAQEALLQKALKNGGIEPKDLQYLEVHGTGTSLGDPIEVLALSKVLGEGRSPDQPLFMGSVKTNFGHLESAAGVASLIKVVLAQQHQQIPAHLHFNQPNPYIPWERLPVKVPTQLTTWPAANGKRLAGVSSFGMSGTNVHLIVEDVSNQEKFRAELGVSSQSNRSSLLANKEVQSSERTAHILTLSAKNEQALQDLVESYQTFLASQPETAIGNICFTANSGRSQFKYRRWVIAETLKELRENLAHKQEQTPLVALNGSSENDFDKIAFLFTGQGAQYPGMGRELYQTQPTFRFWMNRCAEILAPYLEQPLTEILYANDSSDSLSSLVDQTRYTQPLLFSLEYSLYQLWRSWGIEPTVMMGHSVGEYVAACIAGVFSLEDGLKLIAARGRLMQALPKNGAMAAIMASESTVSKILAPHEGAVVIAAINGPTNLVISGERDSVEQVAAVLEAEEIKVTWLQVSHAFHSPMMQPMLADFAEVAQQVNFFIPQREMISNVTGEMATEVIASADYWCGHILEPVRFAAGMETLKQAGYEIFLEMGPKPILLGMGRQCGFESEGIWLPSLRSGQSDWQTILNSLGQLYEQGMVINWSDFDRDYSRQRLPLPTYPFQRKRYWQDKTAKPQTRLPASDKTQNPLLGQALFLADSAELRFETQIAPDSPDYLKDHCVYDAVVLPATGYLEIALAAGKRLFKVDQLTIAEVVIQNALILPENEIKTLQVLLKSESSSTASFKIFSLQSFPGEDRESDSTWRLHVSGKIQRLASLEPESTDLAAWKTRCSQSQDISDYYQHFHDRSIDYGTSFQALKQLWRGENASLAQIHLPQTIAQEIKRYQLHPVLLDNSLQALAAACPEHLKDKTYLPIGLEQLYFYPENLTQAGDAFWSYAEIDPTLDQTEQTLTADVCLVNSYGKAIAIIKRLKVKQANAEAFVGAAEQIWQDWLYEVAWQPKIRFNRPILSADDLPTPAQISDSLQTGLTQQLTQPSLQSYQEVFEQLEVLSAKYVLNAFMELDWLGQVEPTFNPQLLTQQLGIVSQHHRLFNRLLEILAEVGVLEPVGERWKVAQVPDTWEPKQLKQSLAVKYPAAIGELTLIERCGEQLSAALKGKIDPLELLFPQGDFSTTTQIYQHSPGAQLMNGLVQKAIGALLAQLPSGQGARILEIGAGTGGTTAHILPHLNPQQVEYVFTDVGTIFLTQAAEKFQDYPFVSYQILDIESTPETQGFEPHQYDVIVAANVLHATKDLRQTLQHIQQLLKPGGLLVLLEGMAKTRWLDLTFGLTEGWWRFDDSPLRSDYPLISANRWQQLCQEVGFKETMTLPVKSEGIFHQSVIIAQSAAVSPEVSQAKSRSWLILADHQGKGRELSRYLRDRGDDCHLAFCETGDGTSAQDESVIEALNPQDYLALLDRIVTPDSPLTGVVHLWSLDAAPCQSLTSEDLTIASQQGCGSTLQLVQALSQLQQVHPPNLWLVTQGTVALTESAEIAGTAQSPLWGMGKVINQEYPDLNCVCLDIAADSNRNSVEELLDEICAEPHQEDQVAVRDGKRFVARLNRARAATETETQKSLKDLGNQPYQLAIPTRGLLEGLRWQPLQRRSPQVEEVEICVEASGLNFLDVLDVLGLSPYEREGLGGECAGTIVAIGAGVENFSVGDQVIAIAPNSFSQYVTVNASLVIHKPNNLPLNQAATIPINFLTAYYALEQMAKLQPGERVLIHAAAGGTGLAAVQIAQQIGAEVFATASPGKWDFLKSLGIKQVMNSRSVDFAAEIMDITEQQGVDVIFNSLTSEDFVLKNFSVLAKGGRYLEIAKRDAWDSEKVAQIRPDVAYYPIDLRLLSLQNPQAVGTLFSNLIKRFKQGQLTPLPTKTFPLNQIVNAFRYMQQAKHIGKIVVLHPPTLSDSTQAQGIGLSDKSSYLISGGTGGLGLLVTRWLIEKGARHILLTNRQGLTPTLEQQILEFKSFGAEVTILKADVTDAEQMAHVFEQIERSHPPLRGIIHGAGVLDDGTLQHQTWERFERVMQPKVEGAWHLHQLSQSLTLDFFILFSSAAALLGPLGQANHAAANAFLDGLAYQRRAQGLPALSINWGPVSEIGAAAQKQADEWVTSKGMGTISPTQVLEVLEHLWSTELTQVGVMPIQWPQFSQQFRDWPFIENFDHETEITTAAETEFREQLECLPAQEQQEALSAHVCAQIAKVLGLNPAEGIDPDQGFFDLGMDSLTSVELRNRLQTSLNCRLPTTVTIDYPTLPKLVDYLAEEILGLVEEQLPIEPAPASQNLSSTDKTSEPTTELTQLSEAELADLLSEKLANLD